MQKVSAFILKTAEWKEKLYLCKIKYDNSVLN